MAEDEVLVVGGGWAGLAAAVQLSAAGRRVRLLEAAPQLGGRARTVHWDGQAIDNGQHLLIGAYRDTLALIRELGCAPETCFQRLPLELNQWAADGDGLRLRAAPLPAPFHVAAGLLRAGGLTLGERLRALAIDPALKAKEEPEGTARAWLETYRQPPALIRKLWEPLCVAALNTPLEIASARLLKRTLRDAFAPPRANSELLIPRVDLGRALPEPARRFVEARGGRMETGRRVTALVAERGRMVGVESGGERIDGRQVILATHPAGARRLLEPLLPRAAADLAALAYQPICTVYLRYPPETAAAPISGLLGTLSQWLFDRRGAGQPGLMAVVLSAEGAHNALDNATLGHLVATELARRFPWWPAPLAWRVIREKRATFSATPAAEALRPTADTPIAGLQLAGDYTATGLPATLEGAVRSGLQCASRILRDEERKNVTAD
ncbi:hydroxysqualene dehydroxylase HpnE [Endothiovibrio diazotrophicus]